MKKFINNMSSVKGICVALLITWVVYFLYSYFWVQKHDFVAYPLSIVGLVLMVLVVLLGGIGIHHNIKSKNIINVLILVVLLCVHTGMFFSFKDITFVYTSSFTVSEKIEDSGTYYLYPSSNSEELSNFQRVECTFKDYKEVKCDDEVYYRMKMRGTNVSKIAVLESFHLVSSYN